MPILVAALSGRALAAAAHHAGADIVVADLFGDTDTQALAPWHRLPGSLADGIGREAAGLVRELGPLDGIVYGGGFEGAPELLRELDQLAPLIGNTPDAVAAVRDPQGFAEMLDRLGLPHPAIAAAPGADGLWLRKHCGGSGGTHIRPVDPETAEAGPGEYFEAFARGAPFSALFAADGKAARVIGRSVQWTDPAAEQPFRYGGCVGPVSVTRRRARWIDEACDALAASFGLRGLNSLDMLVDGDDITILEINPRPGATIDIFDDGPPWLWDLHCRSVRGELPSVFAMDARPLHAATILYADRPRQVPAAMDWQPWVADISPAGSRFEAGDPVCTILSTGPDIARAREQGRRRAEEVLRQLPELTPQTA
ncbi:MAG TPA: ATP-grasp domain-containing protein [Stellaceae bacterium]|nr:ATP-grasp domain-containing protein [Stellaceae bacterium]